MIARERVKYNLEDAFFPVSEEPISWGEFMGQATRIQGYKAIVDKETGKTLSVVSSRYRLVLNREAYEMADYVVQATFEGKTLKDFECFNILMPKSKGSCRIDLIIPNNFNVLFGNQTESYTPFVRISNSYNRTMVLKYEIGFCRWICKNGCIFGQTGITFAITHLGHITYKEIDKLIEKAKENIGDIGSLWSAFEKKMESLRAISLPISSALPIYCKAFDVIVREDDVTASQKAILAMKARQILNAAKDYFKEMGNNAYAMMNVMTDYASFPEWTSSPDNYVDGYQRRVGKWVDGFLTETKKEGFSLSKYLGDDFQNTAFFLESLVPQE